MPSPLAKIVYRKFVEPAQEMKRSQFETLEAKRGDVIFLGDSITAGGLWHEWFPEVPIRNRGIDGDQSAGVLGRLKSSIGPGPAAVFLLIGTNDIGFGVKDVETMQHLKQILQGISDNDPSTHVFLQSIMPRQLKKRDQVQKLNAQYKEAAQEYGASWIDLWPALALHDGSLSPAYTLDGLHLNGEGYAAWTNVLEEFIAPYATRSQDPQSTKV
ncbi:GDSL-type esterase/lipase family protein [Paenarthrobacter sp. YAF11_1]|uniref:GDSL-type esterase/lipase family protein n=1 Tax=Paenarthrobacter sp. YAF11_1 TaxID=3233074 RepID=UPI003F94F877